MTVFSENANIKRLYPKFHKVKKPVAWKAPLSSLHSIGVLMDRIKKDEISKPEDLLDFQRLGLTEKESKVLKLMASGARRNDIANQLFISPELMKTYVFNIYKKIGAKEVDKVLRAAFRSIKKP